MYLCLLCLRRLLQSEREAHEETKQQLNETMNKLTTTIHGNSLCVWVRERERETVCLRVHLCLCMCVAYVYVHG